MTRRTWRVGWSDDRRRFYFQTPSGYSTVFSGRKAEIRDSARKLLPVMLAVAEAATDADGDPKFIEAIRASIAELGS